MQDAFSHKWYEGTAVLYFEEPTNSLHNQPTHHKFTTRYKYQASCSVLFWRKKKVCLPSHLLPHRHPTQPVPMVCLPGSKDLQHDTTPHSQPHHPCSPSTSSLQRPCLCQHQKRYSPHPRDLENYCHSRFHPLEIHGHRGIHDKRGAQSSSCFARKQSSSLKQTFKERLVTVVLLLLLRHGLKQERNLQSILESYLRTYWKSMLLIWICERNRMKNDIRIW